MELIDFCYQKYGLKGVMTLINHTVFQGLEQYLTRGGTRSFDWDEFRKLFKDELYDIERVALSLSQRLTEREYLYYAEKLKVKTVMKSPAKFVALRCKDLGLDFKLAPISSKIESRAYVARPYGAKKSLVVNEYLEMHYYQLWIKNRVNSLLTKGVKRVIIHLPTGSGKTRTANELLLERLNSLEPGRVIIWVCHSVELCAQAESSMVRLLNYRAQRSVNIMPFYGNAKEFELDSERPNIVYVTYGKLISYRKKNGLQDLSNKTNIVVVDEAHKVLATTYSQIISDLLVLGADLIGLTATPGRGNTDKQIMNKALSAYFYTNLVSYKEVDAGNLFKLLTEQGYLASIEHEVLLHSGSFKLDDDDVRKFNNTGFLPSESLGDLSSNFSRNDEILGRVKQLIKTGKQRILIFAASTEHAKILSALLEFRNVKLGLVLGDTPLEMRQEIYADFKQGEINVIVNYGVLTTGFDEPKLDVCLIARPCSSPVLYSQMVGRALRGVKNGGNSQNLIIDVSDNFVGMPALDQLFVRWNLNF